MRKYYKAKNSLAWKGGKTKDHGYVLVLLQPDDFFYPMANGKGYVREHRLVIAQHLNRCLLPWEVVHHKNGIKDDNRFENLQLFPGNRQQQPDMRLKARIKRLEQQLLNERKAGIREGVRRVYEDVKAHHYIIDYDLEVVLKALEKYKDKIALAGGGIGDAMVKIGAKPSRKGAPKVGI